MSTQNICCPKLSGAMEVLGKKWTCLIVRSLMDGPRRFSEMASYVDGLSDRVLSERLQELEREDVVERRVYDQRPVLVEYVLTDKGRDLRHVLESLQDWADKWTAESATEPAAVG